MEKYPVQSEQKTFSLKKVSSWINPVRKVSSPDKLNVFEAIRVYKVYSFQKTHAGHYLLREDSLPFH